MCMFSGPVESVTDTQIFARSTDRGRQIVVYQMSMKARREVAMILPIPVAPRSGEKAVRFFNLAPYADFFKDMASGFPSVSQGIGGGGFGGGMGRGGLEVYQVGDYIASFVPTQLDFTRLDPQFRLPDDVWKQLTLYRDYGFAVFKLKPGAQTVHPMAFEFPRADRDRLFFPTVHIHDGKIYQTAAFDHILYCQRSPGDVFRLYDWTESKGHAQSFMKVETIPGFLIPDDHCYRMSLNGRRKNQDVWLA